MARATLLLSLVVAVLAAAAYVVTTATGTAARTTDAIMALSVSSGGACDGGVCTVPLGAEFALSVEVVAAPAEGYAILNTDVDYSQLASSGGRYKPTALAGEEIAWPDGTGLASRVPSSPEGTEGRVQHFRKSNYLPPYHASFFEGIVLTLDMHCSDSAASSVVMLIPYSKSNPGGASFALPTGGYPRVPVKASPLTITCAEPSVPTPLPTATPQHTATPLPPTPPNSRAAPGRRELRSQREQHRCVVHPAIPC